MTRPERTSFGAAVRVLVVCSAIGLLLILAGQFSAMAAASNGRLRPPVPVVPLPVLVTALAVFAVALLVTVTRLVLVSLRGADRRPRRSHRQAYAIAAILASGFLLFYVITAVVLSLVQVEEEEPIELPRGEGEGEPAVGEFDEPAVEEPPPEPEPVERVDRDGLYLLVATGVLALAAGFIGIGAYRRFAARPDPSESEAFERLNADLHATSAKGLARMLKEPDHRLAVIAAYALVEDTLDHHGFSRDPASTPLEFMRSTLDELESRAAVGVRDGLQEAPGGALLALTELYEVAKFSEHPVGADERARAVASLEEIGGTLHRFSSRRSQTHGASTHGAWHER